MEIRRQTDRGNVRFFCLLNYFKAVRIFFNYLFVCTVNRELRNKANREELIKYVLSDEHHQGVAKDTVLPGDV